MSSPALQFDNVAVEYHRKGRAPVRAVAGVSLKVTHGQVHALVGESGCGKSTVARASSGLIGPVEGRILFEGEPVQTLGRRARSPHLRRLQMIFQDPSASLNPRRAVGDQIEAVLKMNGASAGRTERDGRVRELLDSVGLAASAAGRYPRELSGGQRQRACLARALAAEPTVLVADEPISALDASAQAQIANLLVSLARDLNIGLLFISHDLAVVRHIADVVTVMYLGRVVESATSRELWQTQQHPYSEALVAAEPLHDGSGTLPAWLPGEVPDPGNPPTGCRFHPRCPHAFDRCPNEEPPLFGDPAGRQSACWLRQPTVSG